MWHGTDVFLNRTIECQYNGKARVGKVVKATPDLHYHRVLQGLFAEAAVSDVDSRQNH